MHKLSAANRRNKSLPSLQEINPIMADLLIKRAVAPEQLGLQKDDVRILETNSAGNTPPRDSSKIERNSEYLGIRSSSFNYLEPLALETNGASSSSSSSSSLSLPCTHSFVSTDSKSMPSKWACEHELLKNDDNTEILLTTDKWYFIAIRLMLIVLVVGYLVMRGYFLKKYAVQSVQYTIRVNTFRRNDLLLAFLDHYLTCPSSDLGTYIHTFI